MISKGYFGQSEVEPSSTVERSYRNEFLGTKDAKGGSMSIAENNSQVDVDELIEVLPEPRAGLGWLELVDGLSTLSTIGLLGGLWSCAGKPRAPDGRCSRPGLC